jgi:hypothetical protein
MTNDRNGRGSGVGEGGTIEKVNRTHSQNETPSNCGGWGFLSYWKLPSHDLTLTALPDRFQHIHYHCDRFQTGTGDHYRASSHENDL